MAAARELAKRDTTVHVIGFGLGNAADEDTASLAAIAHASGGRFLTARTGEELREALATAVGTPFRLLRDAEVVGEGALGSDEPLRVPEGHYRLRLKSKPPREVEIDLVAEEGLVVSFEREGGVLSHREPVEYASCEETVVAKDSAPRAGELPESLPGKHGNGSVETPEAPSGNVPRGADAMNRTP